MKPSILRIAAAIIAFAGVSASAHRAGAESGNPRAYSVRVASATGEPITLRYCGTRECARLEGEILPESARGVAISGEHGARIVLQGWRGDRRVAQRVVELRGDVLNRVMLEPLRR
jgi:hypothetical protein